MSKIIAALVLMAAIFICATLEEKREQQPAKSLSYIAVDTSNLRYKQKVYVPVTFYERKGYRQNAKAVLRIRNTSFSDSLYLTQIEYYDTHGNLLKNFIDSTLLLKPMTTSEIVVKNNEFKKSGDNFIVQWHSNNETQPLIQSLTLHQNKPVITDYGITVLN